MPPPRWFAVGSADGARRGCAGSERGADVRLRACSSGVPVIGCTTEVVRGAYGVVGAGVPLVGGCAGDDLKMTRTFQLYDDHLLTDAVVGAPTRGMRGFHNQTLVVLSIS